MKRLCIAISMTLLIPCIMTSKVNAEGWQHNGDGTTGWKTLTAMGIGEGILFIASSREAMKSGEVKNFSAFTKLCSTIFKQFVAGFQKKSDRVSFASSLKKYPITSTFVLSLIGCGTYFAIEDILVSPRKYRASFKLGAIVILLSTVMARGNNIWNTYLEPNSISHYSTIFALKENLEHLQSEAKKIQPKLQSYLKSTTDLMKDTQNKVNTSLYKQFGQLDKALVGTQNTLEYLGKNMGKSPQNKKSETSNDIENTLNTICERIESLEHSYEEITTSLQTLQSIIEDDETKSEEAAELLAQLQASQMELKILRNQFETTVESPKSVIKKPVVKKETRKNKRSRGGRKRG